MPSFLVRYFDPARVAVVEEQLTAESDAALRNLLAGTGRVILTARAAKIVHSAALGRGAAFDVAWWCRELATLLKAGMTVVEALETLHSQATGGAREKIHSQLLRSLREGQSLSRALRAAGTFPLVLVASVTASERTSKLSEALEEFVRYDDMLQRLRRQAVSAAIYPGVVVSLGVLIALFLLLYVIPRFSQMYASFHGAVSLPTQILISVSRLLHDRLPWVLGVLATLLATGIWAWREGRIAAVAAFLIKHFGPLQRQLQNFDRAKLYQSLAMMFRGGYTLDEALAVCEGMGLGPKTAAGISLARAELARGRSVVAAFGEAGIADPVGERLLAVGERSGGFEAVLQTIAERHANAFATFVERSTRIIEPLLLLIVALVVGGIVLMMYMPIFDIANGVR